MKYSKDKYDYANLIRDVKRCEMQFLQDKFTNTSEEILASDIFYRKMNKLISTIRKKRKERETRKSIIAIVLSVLLLIGIFQPQMYVNAGKWIFEQFKNYYNVQFKEGSQDVLLPDYELTYIPNGYVLEDELGDSKSGKILLYTNDEGEMISLEYNFSDASININSEGVEYKEYVDNAGQRIYYMQSTTAESSCMIWLSKDEKVVFTLFANEKKDEMQKIVDGVKEK